MQVLDCLNMLASRLPKDDKGTFLTFLSQTLLGENSNIAHQLREFPQGVDRSHLKALLNGYLTLGKAGLLKPALKVRRCLVLNMQAYSNTVYIALQWCRYLSGNPPKGALSASPSYSLVSILGEVRL